MNYLFQSVLLLSLIFAAVLAADGPYYSVVSPSVLRPNSNFHVAVSVQGASRSVAVTVEVTGTQDGGGPFSTQQSISVEPYSTKVLRLEIGDIGPGSYKLRAIGSGGLSFTNDTELEYVHKSYSVFIQTDKAIYKPGDLMQFRCIVLNAHLKPSVTGSLNVHITDGQGNRVKQWTRALTKRGVFAGELQLSKEPVLGDWNISVTVLDQTTSKSVLVAEYVLPRFEVAVEAPDHITFKEDKIPVTIRTKYTYGKPVEGNATITVYPIIYSGVIQPIFQLPIRKVVPVSGDTGKAAAVFFVTDELQLSDEYERTVVVDVEVEEALTGRRQNASVQVRVHKYSYRIELIKSAEYYKPGLPYEATIRISTHSGAPVYDKVNPVIVRHGWSYDSDSYTESKHMLDEHGMVSLKFTPPKDQNHTVLGIEAQYLDLKEWFSAVAAAMSPGNEFMQATIVTDKIKLNADVEVRVDSTTALKYVSYVVMGRGDVLTAGQARPSAASNNQVQFRFTATYAMAPVAHLVVYYVSDGGEMIADTVDIDVDGALQNFVEIDSSTWDTAPGKDVELRFRAKPDSYIGVLAVDQSVLLLRDGNDLSRKRISNELRMYDSGKSSPYLPLWADEEDEKPLWRPGSSTAKEAFDKSGTTVITNSLVYEQYPLYCNENADSYQYQLQSMWQKCWNTNQSLVHNLRFRERGPLKSWRPETMAEAIFSVLKEGLSLSQAARKYDIPYPTFVLYANRVHNMLGPSADGGADLRPKGRGRPQRILLGVWPDEHIRGVIRAVVFRDSHHHIKEEAHLAGAYPRLHDGLSVQSYPSSSCSNGPEPTVSPSSAAAAAVAAVAQGLRQQMCSMVAAAQHHPGAHHDPISLVNSLSLSGLMPGARSPTDSAHDLRISPATSAHDLDSPMSSPLTIEPALNLNISNNVEVGIGVSGMTYKPPRSYSSPRPENLFQEDIEELVKSPLQLTSPRVSISEPKDLPIKMESMAECRGE